MNKDNEENEVTSEEVETSEEVAEDQQTAETEEEQPSLQELLTLLAVKASEEEEEEDELNSMRSIGLYGDVEEEERISEVISALLTLHHVGKPKYDAEGELKEEGKPIKLYVSTYGGSADDMAALVDIMNYIKKDCPIETIGIGNLANLTVKPTSAATSATNPIYKADGTGTGASQAGQVLLSEWTPLNGAVGELATVSVTWPVSGQIVKATS